MPASLDIEVPRQGDYVKEFQFTDLAGVPINLTGHTLTWEARAIAGAGTVVADATITVLEAANGRFRVVWHGPDFDAVGEPTERVRVAHDLKDTYPDSTVDVPFRGQLIIYPEVTA